MASVDRLKERLGCALKARKIDAALETIAALSEIEPHDPIWPKRAARLLAATEDVDAQLGAWRRALELQIAGGLVLDAIASCKAILEIAPDDEASRDCLDRLHLNRHSHEAPAAAATGRRAHPQPARDAERDLGSLSDAPLESLVLTELIPGARSVVLGDAEPGLVNEIEIDFDCGVGDDDIVDLRLEQWSSKSDLGDLAAAQAAALPSPAEMEETQSGEGRTPSCLRRELANIPLFGDLDPSSLHTLIRRVRVVQIKAGQILFREGDAANTLYVIVEGAVTPIAEGERRRKLAVLERGEFFGEIGVLTKQPRNATIEALVDSQLLAIDRRVLWELIEKQPGVARNILRFLRARLIDRQIRTNLFFAAFVHGEREAVARQFRILEVSDGARIVEQGKPPDGLFVVLAGSLELVDRKHEKVVGVLGIGDVLGGLSLLEGRAATADVTAKGKCWLVVLGEARFRRIVEANPRLTRVLRRLAEMQELSAELPRFAAL